MVALDSSYLREEEYKIAVGNNAVDDKTVVLITR